MNDGKQCFEDRKLRLLDLSGKINHFPIMLLRVFMEYQCSLAKAYLYG